MEGRRRNAVILCWYEVALRNAVEEEEHEVQRATLLARSPSVDPHVSAEGASVVRRDLPRKDTHTGITMHRVSWCTMKTCSHGHSEAGFGFLGCLLPPSDGSPGTPSPHRQHIRKSSRAPPSLHHSAWKSLQQRRCARSSPRSGRTKGRWVPSLGVRERSAERARAARTGGVGDVSMGHVRTSRREQRDSGTCWCLLMRPVVCGGDAMTWGGCGVCGSQRADCSHRGHPVEHRAGWRLRRPICKVWTARSPWVFKIQCSNLDGAQQE